LNDMDMGTRQDRTGPVERLALLAVVALIALSGIRLCTGPEETLAFLLYDDAYYYFGVARNLAAGHGSTFDGIHSTNGYHPLWCWLLVPVFALVDDPGRAVRVIGAVWFVLAAVAPCALWWALRPRTGASGAVMAAALFGLHGATFGVALALLWWRDHAAVTSFGLRPARRGGGTAA